jgi:hypothetical protein
MKTQTFKIKPLFPGQVVAIANCGTTATVVLRKSNGVYDIEWKGDVITVPRTLLAVKVNGIWKHGPANTTDAIALKTL